MALLSYSSILHRKRKRKQKVWGFPDKNCVRLSTENLVLCSCQGVKVVVSQCKEIGLAFFGKTMLEMAKQPHSSFEDANMSLKV
jgi:hypothetical protein